MKSILKEYLRGLKERKELDSLLPSLLSTMGLNVITEPSIGTTQHGVDCYAVGRMPDESDSNVYLLTIKSGDLSRTNWDNGDQAVRASLNEILDVYVKDRILEEHKKLHIKVCICFGGDIKENILSNVSGFIDNHTKDNISFEIWNGDKIADLILNYMMTEKILFDIDTVYLKKSLSLVDSPDDSFNFFRSFAQEILNIPKDERSLEKYIRILNVSTLILHKACEKTNNLECAYLASELAYLYNFDMINQIYKTDVIAQKEKIIEILRHSQYIFLNIADSFFAKIRPYLDSKFALSFLTCPASEIDANLKLFDILGRMATTALIHRLFNNNSQYCSYISDLLKLIYNNPVLLSPIKEEQTIDISLGFLLLYHANCIKYLNDWISSMVSCIDKTLLMRALYPRIDLGYEDLLKSINQKDEENFKNITCSSVLYSTLAFFSLLLENVDLFRKLSSAIEKHLPHCNLQAFFFDENSDEHFYRNDCGHGVSMVDISLLNENDFFNNLVDAIKKLDSLSYISASKIGLFDIIIVGCRHHRIPLPWEFFYKQSLASSENIDQDEVGKE